MTYSSFEKCRAKFARLNSMRAIVGIVGCLLFASAGFSTSVLASEGDTSLSQRGGYVLSKGDLSRDTNHVALMFAAARSFHGPMSFLGLEAMHQLSFLYDSFYALGEDQLKYPIVPHAQARIIEPTFAFDFCFFSTRRVRPCLGAGFSAVYLQSSIQNYQMYAAFPAQARIMYASFDNIFFYELGVRYRSFQNRTDGYLAKHADLMSFFGIGLFFPGQGM
ncbi:hypothetical protein EBU99_13700 [bacterium]|nr:hypothetical protein [bacterium]